MLGRGTFLHVDMEGNVLGRSLKTLNTNLGIRKLFSGARVCGSEGNWVFPVSALETQELPTCSWVHSHIKVHVCCILSLFPTLAILSPLLVYHPTTRLLILWFLWAPPGTFSYLSTLLIISISPFYASVYHILISSPVFSYSPKRYIQLFVSILRCFTDILKWNFWPLPIIISIYSITQIRALFFSFTLVNNLSIYLIRPTSET